MKLSPTFWGMRFMWVALWMSLALTIAGGLGLGLWYPISRWIFADGWQWMPLERWLKYALLCIPGGIFCGGLFTLGDWLEHGEAGPVRKVIVSSVIVASLVLICIVLGSRAVFWVIPLLAR